MSKKVRVTKSKTAIGNRRKSRILNRVQHFIDHVQAVGSSAMVGIKISVDGEGPLHTSDNALVRKEAYKLLSGLPRDWHFMILVFLEVDGEVHIEHTVMTLEEHTTKMLDETVVEKLLKFIEETDAESGQYRGYGWVAQPNYHIDFEDEGAIDSITEYFIEEVGVLSQSKRDLATQVTRLKQLEDGHPTPDVNVL